VPIVFLTAVFRDEAHIFKAYSAGAVDVVFKPVDPFILRSKVQVLVDLHIKTLELEQQSESRRLLLEENARIHAEKLAAERALRRTQERQEAILRLPVVFHSRTADAPYEPLFVGGNVMELTGFPPTISWPRPISASAGSIPTTSTSSCAPRPRPASPAPMPANTAGGAPTAPIAR
jgi:hypothetical protein